MNAAEVEALLYALSVESAKRQVSEPVESASLGRWWWLLTELDRLSRVVEGWAAAAPPPRAGAALLASLGIAVESVAQLARDDMDMDEDVR